MELDLGSLCSICRFVKQFSNRYRHLDVLINNAGTFCMKREETSDSFEKTMGTNYFGPFLLTHLLLQSLRKSPKARIINIGSNAHFYGHIDLCDLQLKRGYQGFKAYASSKLAIVVFTQELAERLKDTHITGKYFYKKKLREVSAKSRDMHLQKRLWELS